MQNDYKLHRNFGQKEFYELRSFSKFCFNDCYNLIKKGSPRKAVCIGKKASSVLLKLIINGNKNDMSQTKCSPFARGSIKLYKIYPRFINITLLLNIYDIHLKLD